MNRESQFFLITMGTVFLAGLGWGGCGGTKTEVDGTAGKKLSHPYTIVTTTGMVTDIVRQVAGEKATVEGLMGAGVDPHLYKPTRDDVAKLLKADVVFYSGLMLEGRMTDTFLKVARKGTPVYAVTELLGESYLMEPENFHGHWDPHVWMDVGAWLKAVEVVREALTEVDPANGAYYKANTENYLKSVEKLDAYVREVIGSIPEEQRVLVTAHDAFGYFSRAYGIQVKSAQGISTESEAGVEDINRLVDVIVKNKIKAIFVETSVSDKNMRAVLEGARAKGQETGIGGSLFSDAMGQAGTYEGTYIGMLDHNATIIARALGGKAPEKGFQSKLKAEPSK